MVLHPIVFFPKFHNLSLTMKKKSNQTKLRDILQNAWPILPKTVRVMKMKERLKLWLRIGNNKMQFSTLDWLLEHKEDTDGKTGGVQIKSRV